MSLHAESCENSNSDDGDGDDDVTEQNGELTHRFTAIQVGAGAIW